MDCARNIITANFSGGGTSATTAPLWQWDYGQGLCITGIDLPAAFEVHFSTNKTGGVSTVAVGADGQVTIPNGLLTIGKNLNAWIYLSDSEGEGETEYSITIPVKARPMPETYDAEVTGEFDDVVRQVGEYAETAQTAADNAGASATAAAASASEAAASASAAETAKTAAETAQGKAEDAQAAAETAAQTATENAQQTAQDAAQAALDAGRAESAAGRAEAAETGAESAKTDAETAAQGAAASASAASASATNAGQAATSAAQSAMAAAQSAASIDGDVQTATQKAAEATAAAGQAVAAKDAAVTAQQGAETAATNAGQSASTATTKAAEAAQSASSAAQSKTDAEAAATRAETAAASLTVDSALSNSSVNPVQNKVITGEIADVKNALNERIDFTDSYIMTSKAVTLPGSVRGNFKFKKNDVNDLMISGTNNVAQLLSIKTGTYDINGVTIIVNNNTVSVSGQPTADFNFHFESGTKKTATELMAMTLGLPEHVYTLSQKVTSGTVFPSILIRSKTSGNVSVAQNNTNVFTMDKTTCGGFYMPFQSNKNYSCSFDIALLPYSTDNGNKFRSETSNISVYDADGIYPLDGYTWIIGNPTVKYLESLLPKKPKCKYSLRTIDYSSMTECLDVYIPASNGYVNYIFGHTENAVSGGNVWRLVQVDAVNDALVYRHHITQLGETEMAIQIKDRDDFIGGTTHGDEVMDADSLLFVVDGKPTDITTLTNLTEFETLQCFLVSDLYDPADHTTLVGKHGREWKFDKNGLYIGQTVEFLSDLTLGNSYMPMLCVLRGNDTASALQVTDTYADDGNYQQYDVGTGGFTTYPNKLKTDVREINLFGKVSGIRASLQIIEQPEGLNKEGTFLYNGVNTYNKIYCCMCGYGGGESHTQNVSNGDKWKVKSQITIDVG